MRPYIICHMVTSIDGKVTGDFLFRPECERATEIYYELNRKLKNNGFICGRVTMEESFTKGRYPDLARKAEGSRTIVGFRGKFSPLPSLHSLVIRQYNCGKRALSGTKISV